MLDSLKRSVFTTILTVCFTFIVGVVIARVLGPEQRGELGYIMVAGSVIWSLCNLGLHDSYIYFKRSRYKNIGSRNIFILVFSVSIMTAFILAEISKNAILKESASESVYILLIISYVFYYLTMHLLQIQEGMVKYNLVKLLLPIINLVFLAIFSMWGFDTSIAVIMYISSYMLIGIYAFVNLIKTEFNPGKWEPLPIRNLSDYALKSYGVAAFGVLISNFDKVFFFISGEPTDFGIYIVAYTISRNVSLIPNTLATVLFANYAGRDEEGLAKSASGTYSLLFFPMIIMFLFIVILAYTVLPFIFGKQYEGLSLPFSILVLEAIFSSLGWILAQRFMASGKPGLVLVRQLLSIIPLVVIATLNIPYLSMPEKIAVAMLSASLFRLVITMYIYKNTLNEDIPKVNFNIFNIYNTFKSGMKKNV